jgi:hypothetical protein
MHARVQKVIELGVSTGLALGVVKLASLCKFSWIAGSYTAFFSGSSAAMPLVGAFTGTVGSITTFVAGCLLGGVYSLKFLAYHVPGLFGAFYWSSSSFVVRVLVPALCFGIFIRHPVGSQAWPYALYWLVPIALYFYPRANLFVIALASTLVAHAVGSVIWLYAVPMPATAWLALIPVVACERIMIAASMVVMHRAFSSIQLASLMNLRQSFFLQIRSLITLRSP